MEGILSDKFFNTEKKRRVVSGIVVILLGLLIVFAVVNFFSGPKPFSWMDGKSSLGVLLEGGSYNLGGGITYEVAYLSGVPREPYRSPNGYWILPINFGTKPITGEPIILNWAFGSDADTVLLTKVEGKKVIFDPTLENIPEPQYVEVTVRELIEGLNPGYMYPMELLVSANNYMSLSCIQGGEAETESCQNEAVALEKALKDNASAVAFIKGELETFPEGIVLTLPPSFYDVPRSGLLNSIGKTFFPRASAQDYNFEGRKYTAPCDPSKDTGCYPRYSRGGEGAYFKYITIGDPIPPYEDGISCHNDGSPNDPYPGLTVYTAQKRVLKLGNEYCSPVFGGPPVQHSYTDPEPICVDKSVWKCVFRLPRGNCIEWDWAIERVCREETIYYWVPTISSYSCAKLPNKWDDVYCSGVMPNCPATYTQEKCAIDDNSECVITKVERKQSCGVPPRLPAVVVDPLLPPTSNLSVTLLANPSIGNVPLSNVDLTAVVSGTETGTINYNFYCDRSDAGVSIGTPDHKVDASSSESLIATDICDYPTAGTYSAKVIVERGALQKESRTTVTVGDLPSVDLTANPSSIAGGEASTLTWSVDNADSCTASGSWSGNKSISGGSESVSPPTTASYTLSCNNENGSGSDSAIVVVGIESPVDVNVGGGKKANGCYDATWEINVPGIGCVPTANPPLRSWTTAVTAQLASGATSGEVELCDVETATKITLTCGQYEDSATITAPFIREINPGETPFNLFFFLRGLFPGFVKSSYAGN